MGVQVRTTLLVVDGAAAKGVRVFNMNQNSVGSLSYCANEEQRLRPPTDPSSTPQRFHRDSVWYQYVSGILFIHTVALKGE